MRFSEIKKYTRWGNYAVNMPWDGIEEWVQDHSKKNYAGGLDLNPDFQRGYVWTPEQKTRYVEHGLKGGVTGMDLHFNCPGWNRRSLGDPNCGPFVIVDGKQRLQAVRDFFVDKVKVFGGHVFSDFIDKFPWASVTFKLCINDLETRAEVLQWYLDLNTGGTVHSDKELHRVRSLLQAEQKAKTVKTKG